jgi:hypothetical protein
VYLPSRGRGPRESGKLCAHDIHHDAMFKRRVSNQERRRKGIWSELQESPRVVVPEDSTGSSQPFLEELKDLRLRGRRQDNHSVHDGNPQRCALDVAELVS